MTAIQNMGLAGVNQINGFIIDSQTPDHKPSQKGYEVFSLEGSVFKV